MPNSLTNRSFGSCASLSMVNGYDLGSSNGATREKATQDLLKVGEEALPFINEAMKSEDVDLRQRAEKLYARIDEDVKYKRTKALGIDVLVERCVRNQKKLAKEDWHLVLRWAEAIRANGIAKGAKIPVIAPAFLELDLKTAGHITPENGDRHILIGSRVICESIQSRAGINRCLALSGGDVEALNSIDSIVIASGNTRIPTIVRSIIICDGDIETRLVVSSILIARRAIRPIGKEKENFGSLMYQNDPTVEGERFFLNLAALGVQFNDAAEDLRITKVSKDSPFAKSGIMTGDKIIAIDGVKTQSVEILRKQIRRALVQTFVVVDVIRDREPLQIKVLFSR